MIEDQKTLRAVQLSNLKNLKKLDEVCKKHNIRYWVAYGTLIGTVRHKGFIPWDDDIDVEMLREDYLKLCEVPAEEWGDTTLFCSAYSDDERHDKIFGRVYQKNTKVQSYVDVDGWRSRKTGESWYTSVMLDIFIVEHIPDSDEEFRRIYRKLEKHKVYYKWLKLSPVPGKSLKQFAKYCVVSLWRIAGSRKGKPAWVRLVDDARKIIAESNPGKRYGLYCTSDDNIYEEEDIFPLAEMPYEDMIVPVPRNYHKMLTDMYGDYMKFPPETERYHLNFIYCDLGDGQVFVIDPVKNSLGEKAKTAL